MIDLVIVHVLAALLFGLWPDRPVVVPPNPDYFPVGDYHQSVPPPITCTNNGVPGMAATVYVEHAADRVLIANEWPGPGDPDGCDIVVLE